MTLTGDHKKMSVDDTNVQTANKVNAVSRINRKFAKLKIVSPTAMAKLAIDSDRPRRS